MNWSWAPGSGLRIWAQFQRPGLGTRQRHRLHLQSCRDESGRHRVRDVSNGRDIHRRPTLTAKAVSTTQINLNWNTVAGVKGYVVDELIAGVWKPIGRSPAGSTGCSVIELSPGVTYFFKVAHDWAGTEFWVPSRHD